MPHAPTRRFDLFITADFPPSGGGDSTYFDLITKNYPGDVRVLTSRCGQNNDDSVDVIRVGWPGRTAPLNFLLYGVFALKKKNIRFIHCGQLRSIGPTCFILKKLFGIPYGVHVYGGERSKYADRRGWRFFMKRVLLSADVVFAISRWTANQFVEYVVAVEFLGMDASRGVAFVAQCEE